MVISVASSVAATASERERVAGPRYVPTALDRSLPPTPEARPGPRVALTFDDGPSPQLTPYILDVLAAKRVPATFFLQGDHSEVHPDLVRRVHDEGHVVGQPRLGRTPGSRT